MPSSPRRDVGPPRTGPDEKDVLLGFLDYLRAAVIGKVEGVGEPQLRTPGVTSGTTLLGLVKHLTYVERSWLLGEQIDDWEATFHPGPDEQADDLLRAYRDTSARANAVIADWTDLGAPGPRQGGRGRPLTRRWTLTHLIEESGRHAGHADILRELIDDTTGR